MNKQMRKSRGSALAAISGRTILTTSIFAMLSTTAMAEVKVGGKFDAGYQFKRTANPEITNGVVTAAGGLNQGGKTTEALGDGGASTSRITIADKEDMGGGMSAFVDMDLRFTNINQGVGGLNNNDKKVMGIVTPWGKFAWGTYNIVNLNIAEKPYMVSPKDMEIVKFGISQARSSDLTSRVTEYTTPAFGIGNTKLLFKGSYAFGDKRTAGENDNDSTPIGAQQAGDATSGGVEGTIGDLASWTVDIVNRESSSVTAENGMVIVHSHLTVRPWRALKLNASYNIYKGRNPNVTNAAGGAPFKEKNTNFVVSYNFNDKVALGLEISHLNDLGSNRNSGRGYMMGGAYFLSKTTFLYLAASRVNYARNETVTGGKYDGTKPGFSDPLNKIDERYTRFGIVKEF